MDNLRSFLTFFRTQLLPELGPLVEERRLGPAEVTCPSPPQRTFASADVQKRVCGTPVPPETG
jgi:hypothetical protein